jgi:glycosyltransferase 2 family protein
MSTAPPNDDPSPGGAQKGPSRWLRWLQAALVLCVLAILAVRVHKDAASIRELTPRFTAGDFLPAVGAALIGYLTLPTAFSAMLRALGKYERRYRASYFRVWLQAYFFRYIPGKVVLVAQRIALGRRAGIEPATVVVLLAWESLLLLLGASIVCTACLGWLAAGVAESVPWLALTPLLVIAMLLGFPRVLSLAAAWPRFRRRFGDLTTLKLGYASQLGLALGYGVLWLGLGTSFFFAARLFTPLPASTYPTVLFWFVASYVAGFLSSFAPAGLGVREGLLVVGLSRILPEGQAGALAIAGRLWLTAIELACIGGACLIPFPVDGEGSAPESTSLRTGR